MSDYIAASFHDFADDFTELAYLFQSTEKQLTSVLKEYRKKERYIPAVIFQTCVSQLAAYCKQYHTYYTEAEALRHSALSQTKRVNLEKLSIEKDRLVTLLRTYQGIVGSVITATDWQSPSFLYSQHSLAGRQTGLIQGTINDYKRDQHLDEKHYEDQFLSQNIDGFIKLTVQIYAVQSGMAALLTILTFLLMDERKPGNVLLGKSSYFENKELVHKFFQGRVTEIAEMDTEAVYHAIIDKQPSMLFFDSIGNTPDVSLPNLPEILAFLSKQVTQDTYVVIDNTCLSVFFQPLGLIMRKNRHLRLLVFESLNKYHQFGMDRVTGGIIWAYGPRTGKLFYAREHAGTNILDSSVYALPFPNRWLITKRLLRFERNALFITQKLQAYILSSPRSPFAEIVYPGLSGHPAYSWTKQLPFHGSYFRIAFKKPYAKVSVYQRFIKAVMAEAKKQQVPLVSGTSFGMNTSRIYLTALRAGTTEPFIRFSVGTESREQVEQVAVVLLTVMQRFSSSRLLSFLAIL